MADIIRKKQLGKALDREEIRDFISGYVSGEIPDYQASAFIMAVWFKGMDREETAEFTSAMAESGAKIDLSAVDGLVVDKHSSGGVADTTTIAVGPLVAACGGKVAKMSGRGLSFTGGTLDKLESIPGFRVDLNMKRFIEIVNTCGVSIVGQTEELVPADKKLYALRDVTSTVDSMPLIAASIMSKKLAGGCEKILLDVKWGSGAFMETRERAEELAQAMVDIGERTGRQTRAIVTDMNQPLGNAIGNAIEVMEAVQILRGEITGDLQQLVVEIAAQMLLMGEICGSKEEAETSIRESIHNGEGFRTLKEMIKMQEGNPAVCDDFKLFPQAAKTIPVLAQKDGWIYSMQASQLGIAASLLGAGRMKKEDRVDHAVGCWMKKRIGDPVQKGDVLAVFFVNDESNVEKALQLFQQSVLIDREKPKKNSLIAKIIG